MAPTDPPHPSSDPADTDPAGGGAPAGEGARKGATGPHRWTVARGLAYSLVPLAALLLLAEGALFCLGLGDPDERLNLTRGFDENANYILPDGPPGAWRTQMFDGETPEIRIPPKGERRRVLLFGGSNTELFPADFLEQQLALADPAPGWEVINLGRRGYGSERVRILLTQAMVTEPDVVVIYSGHNEFVEGEFALELEEEWSSPVMMHVAQGLGRLRVMNVLSSATKARGKRETATGRAPEARTERLDSFADITFERTLLYYAAYEQNLREMVRVAHAAGARVLLCTVVSNSFDVPSIARSRPDLNLSELVELSQIGLWTRRLLPERMTLGLMTGTQGQPLIRLGFQDWRERNPGQELHRVDPVLRPLDGPLAGPPLWSPPRNWTQRTYIMMRSTALLYARELSELEHDQVRHAVKICEGAVAIDPGNAMLIHQLALAIYISGEDDARAADLFRLASLHDYAPNSGNEITNDVVRRLAAATPDLAFLDAEACFTQRCPGGLIGYEVMMDNCHLHIGARRVLMRDMVPEIVRLTSR
jgi:hypothetical protein